jgi:hypothetical protein
MVRVFKTDYKGGEINPWFDTQEIPLPEWCNCNKYLPIKLTVLNYANSGDHTKYGSIVTTTRDIEMEPSDKGVDKQKQMNIYADNGLSVGYLQFN